MKDVTPKSNMEMIVRSIGYAIIVVLVVAFLKIALNAFLSVAYYAIPVALIIYLFMRFGGRK